MLGENHSLRNEFPDHIDTIAELIKSNADFAAVLKQYDLLDQQIRELELKDSPISDESIHELKQQRVEMKDKLYHKIMATENS
ncbi:YdcH family protein [Shewanella olleyana]|uniref:YdcH family protein n=1 Tax=Shewanella olleyana TaxID=135626 RepID=UPI00200BAE8D|nr:YdcH family protein [Shewanella olleyana]MCL1065622.1 YdcH family protein [Shewanella olleyana]